ncbi:MAG: SpoIIE family protein phosphatase [Anaerolineae bacterium]
MAKNASTLLIAHDNQTTRQCLVDHLTAQGHHIEVATNGNEALKVLHKHMYDLVLLGLELPEIAGDAVLEHMKTHADLQNIPVIMMSPIQTLECVTRCIQIGADDFIHEPFSMALLDARVRVCLEKRSLDDAIEFHLTKAEKLADLMEKVILPMGVALSTETDLERLLERILLEAKAVCHADAGTLYMRTEDEHLRFAIVITESLGIRLGGSSGNPVSFPLLPLYDKETNEPNHRNVASHVALTGSSINVPDIYVAEGFDFSATKVFDKQNNYRSVSSLTVPLKDNKGDVVGVLQLLNAQDEDGDIIAFDNYSRIIVEFMASQAAIVLNNHLLIQHQQKLYKLENDIQIARTIQNNFLPSKMPEVPGWDVSAFFQPARDVAGDFYDVFMMLNNRKLGFMIADVCDKGVGAALFMSLTRTLLRSSLMQTRNISWAEGLFEEATFDRENSQMAITANALKNSVVTTNNYITEHHLDLNMFATLFFGMADPVDGTVIYINGGHCPPLIISPTGEIKASLEPLGPAVGMFPGAKFGLEQVKLEPGDTLLAYTDGIPDARNPLGKRFTEAGLMELLKVPPATAGELVQRIIDTVSNHIGGAVQFDDITLLAVRRE